MKVIQFFVCCIAFSISVWAQSPDSPQKTDSPKNEAKTKSSSEEPKPADQNTPLHLNATKTTVSPTEPASGFGGGAQCDDNGNVYLESESALQANVRKLSPAGELLATFKPDTNPDVKFQFAGNFVITHDGELYQWIGEQDTSRPYVLIFKNDGSYKSAIKLDSGFKWQPATLAVFAHGEMLVTGQQYAKVNGTFLPAIPFTGIFSADGRLLKRLDMNGDGELKDAALASKAPPSAIPSDHTITWGRAAAARDGNIYLMRWTTPAKIDAISPGGEIVRSFTVDSGMKCLMPRQIHASGNRLAIWFVDFNSPESVVKIVDLEGNEIATYQAQRSNKNHFLEFGCYAAVPERFTFLSNDEKLGKIQLQEAEAR
jgi:hypothetical protein